MDIADSSLLAAFVFGLASALHCGAMCGGIACSALMLVGPTEPKNRLATLLAMQAGRITTYAALGAAVAAFGAQIVAPAAAGHPKVLQWAAAVSLMWAGLATAGFLPQFAILDRGMGALSQGVERLTQPLRKVPFAAPYAIGLTWGLTPCPLIYAALLTASFTGAGARGASVMAAFGLGTVPAVVVAGLGLSTLALRKARQPIHVAVGLAIALFGFTALYHPWPAIAGLCIPR